MTLAMWFWLFFVLTVIFGCLPLWPRGDAKANWSLIGGNVVLFILLGIVGFALFGDPVK
jgi:hypothetical protein